MKGFGLQVRNKECPDNSGKKRVLVVDDDSTVLDLLERILSRGWVVDKACNAEKAMDLIRKNDYHAVVTDFDMPGKDGVWLLSVLKENYSHIRRILHSGSDPTFAAEHLADGTIDNYLQKPSGKDALLQAVSERCCGLCAV